MDQPTIYAINADKAISETLDGETIVINLETGHYYSMNPSGTEVWTAIAAGTGIPSGNPELTAFLEILENDGLVRKTDALASEILNAADVQHPTVERYTDMQEMLLADPIHDVDESGWPKLKNA